MWGNDQESTDPMKNVFRVEICQPINDLFRTMPGQVLVETRS